jgi:predicted N-acyltransferase
MTTTVVDNIAEIDAVQWNTLTEANFPFADHAFLLALEQSGSVGVTAGWQPHHLIVREGNQIVGACPMYLKTDSYGEYIFDWSWADAFHRHGVPYYPKLVSAIPFTPATGAKLLTAPDCDRDAVRQCLVETAMAGGATHQCSSLHFLFVRDDEAAVFERADLAMRASVQFHWRNRAFASFDDFLMSLKQKRRAEIRRERRSVEQSGVEIKTFTGDTIRPEHIDAIYAFYQDTAMKKWGSAYLARAFFEQIAETFADHTVINLAYRGDRCIAGTIAFTKGNALFGRHWGCHDSVEHLHFELCYYRGIEYAIEHGLELFEAGAQGPHKIQRGFDPVVTRSAHWIAHPSFRNAIYQFIAEEDRVLRAELADGPTAYKS